MGWKDKEKKYLKSLDDKKRIWVERAVNLAPDNDLTLKKREELIGMFPGKPQEIDGKKHKTLNDAAMIMTFVWQVAMKIMAGEYEVINGNMRTAWYKYLEQIYVENKLLASDVGEEVDAVKLLMPAVFQNLLEVKHPKIAGSACELSRVLSGHPREFKKLSRAAREAYEMVRHAARERYVINTMTGAFD